VADDGSMTLDFRVHKLNITRPMWETHCDEDGLQSTVKTIFQNLQQQNDDQLKKMEEMVNKKNLDESVMELCNPKKVVARQAGNHHRRKVALQLARKLSHLCKGVGDPVVIIGDAGGNGGRGRAQQNHKVIHNTLAGFYSVLLIDEFNTSKKTTCCHTDACTTTSAGRRRSKGCKQCKFGNDTRWWNRDAGAALNMISIYLSILFTGQRPAAFTKRA